MPRYEMMTENMPTVCGNALSVLACGCAAAVGAEPEPESEWRRALGTRGVSPYAVFSTEVMGNVSGGFQDGVTAPGLLDLGVELDLEEIADWRGGGFTLTAFAGYGNDGSARHTGDINVVSNLFTDTDFNLFNIFLSQSFADDRVFLKVGQIAADDDFMGTETGALFLNSAFGPLPTQSLNQGAPIFPLAAPGGLVRIHDEGGWYAQTGTYAGDAGPVVSDNHGFQWRTGGAAGWVTFAETGYDYGRGVVKLGGYHHTGAFTDFGTGATETGLSAVYGILDHVLIETAGGPLLSGFVRGSVVAQRERATAVGYLDAGLVVHEVFAPDDALGFGVSHTEFGDDYLAANPGLTTSETILELTYQIPVTGRWMVQPDVQYVLDPHFAGDDALVLGLRTAVEF